MDILMKELAAKAVTKERLLQERQCNAIGQPFGQRAARYESVSNHWYYEAIADFIVLLEYDVQSANPFNKLGDTFTNSFGILDEHHWESYQHFAQQVGEPRLSYGRVDVKGQYSFIYRHLVLMIVSGASCRNPLILDKDFRIIDGLQRLLAMKLMPECEFSAIRLNYVHHEDGLEAHL